MLTITIEKHTLYININLLKSRFKSAIITILKALTMFLTIAGILVIIGTAETSDNHNISLSQITIHLLQGFFLCGVAWVLNFIKLVIEWRRIFIYKLLYTCGGGNMIKTLSINSKKIIFNRIIDIIPTAEASAIYNFLDAELYDNSMYDNLNDLYNDITNSYVEIFNRRGY